VFPNARVQQVVVASEHRRAHIASTLIHDLVSQLERQGYLTITAAVVSDLPAAQAFYERNGFTARLSQAGGQARNRKIILRTRDLETESLFSILEPPRAASQSVIDLGLRKRSAGQAPLYAIDLNVLFDILRDRTRPRAPIAERLIGAALAHQIRLAVAPEFVVELERETKGEDIDPVLKLARQLPRLPSVDRKESDRITALVHNIAFVEARSVKAGTPQALSDARHLAEAALARASGYVTSDGQLLTVREKLLQEIGIDVASLEEFAELLPVEESVSSHSHLKGTDCATRTAPLEVVRKYLEDNHAPASVISEFCPGPSERSRWQGLAVTEAGDVVAIGALIMPHNIDAPARVLVHTRPDHVASSIFADHLLDTQCGEACRPGPSTIELRQIPGQAAVRRAATLRGFLPLPKADTLIKVALGRPVTSSSWGPIARQTRRRTGLQLPEGPPNETAVTDGYDVCGPDGKSVRVRLTQLEDALGPTILMWPGRAGVIVPIAKTFADDLLGTGDQLPLFGSPEAAFVAQRTYFNSPRTASLMLPGVPILFYESRRSGGRGIIAAARIADATVVDKRQVSDQLLRRAVVEDLEPLSSSGEVLATTFDNLLRFPVAVSLEKLRELDAVGTSNLQTTTPLSHAAFNAILELGWSRA
jgi:hypothetical protein